LDVDGALNELPLATHPLIQEYAGFYLDWLAHRTADDYWLPSAPNKGYEQINVPALNISGWYEIFTWSTLENYMGMKKRGDSEIARHNQRVIIGPWIHMNFSGSFPEREFGWDGSAAAIDLPGIHLRWFNRWLKGEENGIDQELPVMIFVMGIDQWRSEADWPLPDTHYQPYYLHSRGGANTLHGDGILSTEPPRDEPSGVYLYNPLRSVPTVGG
jgi:putative CocE/NonD family hydrolase